MGNYNWSRFATRINIKAEIEKIYLFWSTTEGMEQWFLRSCKFITKDNKLRPGNERTMQGDKYEWRWFGYADDVTENGDILEANGKDFIKFSFGKAGNCAVSIKQESGETIVELLQDNIPETAEGMHQWHLGCKTGWTFYLANLKAVLEAGIDLRNKNEQLKSMVNS